MNDQEFELHKAALKEEGIVVEARITGRSDKANNEVGIGLIVQADDKQKVNSEDILVGHDYQVVFFYKGIHPPKPKRPRSQQRRTETSDPTTTVGELPASSEGVTPDLSTEVENAIEVHRKQAALKNLGIAQGQRNDAKFRGFLFDYYRVPLLRNPVMAKEWVRQKQHELMKIDSCAKIYPGSYAESMLRWMQAAFLADERNLPIPSMPREAA